MLEFLDQLAYALSHPNISFFAGAFIAFMADAVLHFLFRIAKSYFSLVIPDQIGGDTNA